MNESIRLEGGRGAEKRIERLRKVFEKRREPFGLMAERAREIISRTFREEGNGDRWKELSPKYASWKRKKVGPATQILVFSGALRQSLEYAGAPKSVNIIRDTFAKIGTRVPHAGFHQFGTKKMAKRSFLTMRKEDVSELRGIMLGWAVKQIRKQYNQKKPKGATA